MYLAPRVKPQHPAASLVGKIGFCQLHVGVDGDTPRLGDMEHVLVAPSTKVHEPRQAPLASVEPGFKALAAGSQEHALLMSWNHFP